MWYVFAGIWWGWKWCHSPATAPSEALSKRSGSAPQVFQFLGRDICGISIRDVRRQRLFHAFLTVGTATHPRCPTRLLFGFHHPSDEICSLRTCTFLWFFSLIVTNENLWTWIIITSYIAILNFILSSRSTTGSQTSALESTSLIEHQISKQPMPIRFQGCYQYIYLLLHMEVTEKVGGKKLTNIFPFKT